MVWNCVLLGYRLKTTYMSCKGHLKVKTGKNPKNIYFYLLTTPLKFGIFFADHVAYQIDNLVIDNTQSLYSQYIILKHTHPSLWAFRHVGGGGGGGSPRHAPNPLSDERRKTLSINHALSPRPSYHHLYIISSHQLTTTFLSYYNIT